MSNLIPQIAVFDISRVKESIPTSDSEYFYPEELGEEKPFLLFIYNLMNEACSIQNILITKITNLEWRERYTFERGGEQAVLDFEYNQTGFVGRVLPLSNLSNSPILVKELELIIKNLSK